MTISVEDSYRLCCRLARQATTNFYVSFLVLPRPKRLAFCAVYAYMRRIDDLADDSGDPQRAARELQAFQQQVHAVLDGQEAHDPMLPALADAVRRYGIPRRHLDEVVEGTLMDQTVDRYATFADLYHYCYHVASCVGLVVLPIFEFADESALKPAEACGIAFQLTNILRDVKEDALRGRIYLPAEDLARFGVTEEEIMKVAQNPQDKPAGFDDRFTRLMDYEGNRAREYYRQAEPLRAMIHRDSRATLGVMIGVYSSLLEKLVDSNYAVFERRVAMSAWEKLSVVLRCWWRNRG